MPNKMETGISLDEMLQRERIAKTSLGRRTSNKPIPTGPRGGGGGGVGKRTTASGSGVGNIASQAPSSLNGRWTHDLHHKVNNPNASRVTKPSLPNSSTSGPSISPSIAASLSGNRLFAALHGGAATINNNTLTNSSIPGSGGFGIRGGAVGPGMINNGIGINIRGAARQQASGFSIKGTAGPFVVRAQNFAPGTTAEDVKTAMMPLGKILSCKLLAATPTVIVELVFEKKEAADACIAKYNNQYADGRLLHLVYHDGPPIGKIPSSSQQHHYHSPSPVSSVSSSPISSMIRNNAAREEADRQRRMANGGTAGGVVDGRYGVSPTPMLYSDVLVSRKGRGFRG